MTLLAALRHGDTAWSIEGRLQGRTDVPLCEAGRAALRAVQLPAPWREARAFTSPLRRCVETAALLGHAAATPEPRLAEMRWGRWEGRRLAELRAALGANMQANEALGFDFTPEGGESPAQVCERLRPWLREVGAAGEPTLAFAHRGVMRVLLAIACDWDLTGKPPHKLDWRALQVFRLEADGSLAPEALNVPLPPATR